MENLEEHLLDLPENLQKADLNTKIEHLYAQQLQSWTMAQNHYLQFETIKKRILQFEDFCIELQHNPARARSTCADLSKIAIETRPCFLCSGNLPKEQKGISMLNKYLLLINPFPIFKRHLTISDFNHIPQQIKNRIIDMLTIAKELENFTIFYNGPRCGASAPDHFHFQAAQKGVMPIDTEWKNIKREKGKMLINKTDIQVTQIDNYLRSMIVFESEYTEPIDHFFSITLKQLPFDAESNEAMINILANYENGKFRLTLFPRSKQRPSCYFKEEADRILISPASVELGGLVITPREADFNKIKKSDLKEIFNEVTNSTTIIF